jgi:chemotaxis protein MotA
MKLIIGAITVFVCVFGAYLAEGGHMEPIIESAPPEFVIIMGTIAGGFMIANPKNVIMASLKSLKLALKGAKFKKAAYLELLCMMYQVFKLAKTKGTLVLEQHVDHPFDSSLFGPFPTFLAGHHEVEFFTDYLRLITLGADKPFEIEALMDQEIGVHHHENEAIVASLATVADSLPAVGIVACVLGVIHAMGAITEPPEVLGRLIGGALVGTFSGILLSYGVFGPLSNCLRQIFEADSKYLECMKVGLLAYLQGSAPSVAVEYARKALNSNVRPSFTEVEEATQSLPAPG